MLSRRRLLHLTGAGLAAAGLSAMLPRLAAAASPPVTPGVPAGVLASASLEALPGKKPLIKLSYRPPNYETPLQYFNETITPNDAFFVRYHLANIPEVDLSKWKLKVGGDAAERSFELTMDEIRRDFSEVEIVAVNQCSGNRRGLANPHVQGIEWGYGAMGNARWKGAKLKDVLAKAGVKKEAVEVAFDGMDSGLVDKTPDFVKSLPIWRALDDSTLIAWEMNGAPLPHWNGFPARIVVPGWTGTYWIKHLASIEIRSAPFVGFWMSPAYRVPLGKFALVDRFVTQETAVNTPITEIVVNSLVTNLTDGAQVAAGQTVTVQGITWDGGYGIDEVAVSLDDGNSWRPAKLGEDLGKYSFRQWSYAFDPKPGTLSLMVRATNKLGASQPAQAVWNPAGYHHNAVQKLRLTVA
jgi:DMSO/TMAO reductase YedYZ molybdopterin-dependent catalytic subunit